jgi:two-component system, cell cycle sensor histidine kinase and response regulator CckA
MEGHLEMIDDAGQKSAASPGQARERVRDGFWLADAQGRLLEVNEACCLMSGFSEAELLGMRVADLYANQKECRIAGHINQALALGSSCFETRHKLCDGRAIDVEVSIQYRSSQGGRFVSFQRDISKARRCEELLRLFQGVADKSSDAIGMSTPEGKHFYQNEAFNNLFGEIGEDPPATVYVDEEVGHEVFRTIMAGGRWTGVVKKYSKDRSVLNILLRAYPDKDAFGRIIGLVGIHTDITEPLRVENALRESEVFIKTVMDNLPIGIAVNSVDPTVSFQYMNDNFTKFFRTTREALSSPDAFWDSVYEDPEFREEIRRRVLDDCASGDPERLHWVDVPITRRGEETTYVEVRNTPLPGQRLTVSTVWDVTGFKLAEESRRESESNLRMLLDSMPAGVWWFDEDGRLEYLNRCFVDQFGFTLEDIQTLDDWYLHAYPDPEYRESYIATRSAAIAAALDAGTAVQPREAKIRCKDGTLRHTIINTQFTLGRTIEIFTDITQREHYHEQIQKMDKLESLGVLAGGIAHDFNNILTGIIGNISFARTLLDESHKSAPVLLNAEKAASRAADLAHQLLTFAKGGQPIKKVVTVRHLLEESVSLVLRGSNVSSNIELPDDLPAIEVDEGQISQVINNLIINASQAMPGGGTITIEGEKVTVDAANAMSLLQGDYLRLTLADTGCGMSEEVQKKIFDPYFTTKVGGSGLGLASVHSIVVKHGGYIEVRSVIGKGTTFELLLPASEKKLSCDDTGKDAVVLDAQHKFSVLVMDDEELIRELVSLMLDSLGYLVRSCANGEEAIALYKAAKACGASYEAVIMDLTIPGAMGGKEAAGHILAIDPHARLIVSSGYSTDPVMAEFANFGFCATLLKPYTMAEISRTIGEVFSARQTER